MGKIQTLVCELCRKESCDGIIYKLSACNKKEDTGNLWWQEWEEKSFCKNSRCIAVKNGKLCYHWVMGHGIEDYFELEPKGE